MKEFKVVIKTLECVAVQAEDAGTALELIKKNIDPRVLGGCTEVYVLEEESEADAPATK